MPEDFDDYTDAEPHKRPDYAERMAELADMERDRRKEEPSQPNQGE